MGSNREISVCLFFSLNFFTKLFSLSLWKLSNLEIIFSKIQKFSCWFCETKTVIYYSLLTKCFLSLNTFKSSLHKRKIYKYKFTITNQIALVYPFFHLFPYFSLRWSRKVRIKITTLVILFPFSLPS